MPYLHFFILRNEATSNMELYCSAFGTSAHCRYGQTLPIPIMDSLTPRTIQTSTTVVWQWLGNSHGGCHCEFWRCDCWWQIFLRRMQLWGHICRPNARRHMELEGELRRLSWLPSKESTTISLSAIPKKVRHETCLCQWTHEVDSALPNADGHAHKGDEQIPTISRKAIQTSFWLDDSCV